MAVRRHLYALNVVEVNSQQAVTSTTRLWPARQSRQLWNNDPEMDSTYNGGDITLNKRLSDGWMMTGGLSVGKNVGYVGVADLNNPNSKTFARGIEGDDVPVSVRMSGLYELPYGLSLSGSYQFQSGFPELTTVSVATTQWRGSGCADGHRQRAWRRAISAPHQVDFSLAKRFGWGAACSSHGSTSTTRQTRDDSYVGHAARQHLHRPSAIQRARSSSGLHYDF